MSWIWCNCSTLSHILITWAPRCGHLSRWQYRLQIVVHNCCALQPMYPGCVIMLRENGMQVHVPLYCVMHMQFCSWMQSSKHSTLHSYCLISYPTRFSKINFLPNWFLCFNFSSYRYANFDLFEMLWNIVCGFFLIGSEIVVKSNNVTKL
jgi:uncharacterized membrane protein